MSSARLVAWKKANASKPITFPQIKMLWARGLANDKQTGKALEPSVVRAMVPSQKALDKLLNPTAKPTLTPVANKQFELVGTDKATGEELYRKI